jgi:catechol-2,3-dioxygenase
MTPTDLTGRNTPNACATLSYQSAARSSSMKIASARRSRSAYSLLRLAENSHAQARPRERMPEHHRARQPEREAELAHFVLEELAQRLEQLQGAASREARRRCGAT